MREGICIALDFNHKNKKKVERWFQAYRQKYVYVKIQKIQK